ncbi:MAG: ABC transporter substrate-binding protein, partial [Candidatus Hodarchaeales archaeon]
DYHIHTRSLSALPGEWDPAITDWYNVIYSYMASANEYIIGLPNDYTQGTLAGVGGPEHQEEWVPILATDWEFEYYPEEMNLQGFNNTGGIKTATFTLRSGVQFHDGSHWNATVYKWNIDRAYLINGNFTGEAVGPDEGTLLGTHLVEDSKPYWTASWNMSYWDSPNLGTTPPATDPSLLDYAYYDLGPNASLVDYPGINILPNNTVRNPTPYGGWDFGSGAAIHNAPYDRYPDVAKVEILENPQSGGKVKVYYNSWSTSGLGTFVNYPQLSYETYRHNYTAHGVFGYENGVLDTRNPTIVDHMIGTGPFIYVEHDETGTPPGGYMLKNENWWNNTANEAAGWGDVDRLQFINFPAGSLGEDAKNTALLTHAIDYAYDTMYMPLDYNAVLANPNIRYENAYASEYQTNIVLNSVNETWWAWPWADAWRIGFYPDAGSKPAGGVPRAMRKAFQFAFNYDLMIGTVLNDRATRAGGIVGTPNLYYNSSVDIATYNLTYAREILLNTETDISGEVYTLYGAWEGYWPDEDLYNFSKACADRGLTASSSDAEWQNIADTNPIYVFNFYWDSAHEDVKSVLQTSLRNIGVALRDKTGATNRVTTIIWDTVRIGHLTTFDGEYGLWSCGGWVMDEHMAHDSPQTNIFWHYVDPDRGRWRQQPLGAGGGGITSWHYWGNFGFMFNGEVDLIYDRIATAAPKDKMKYYSQIADIEQNEMYSTMYLYAAKEGWALWKDWEAWLVPDREGNLAGIWGGVSPQFMKWVGLTDVDTFIPGSPMAILLTVSAISMLGIIYTIMRKKKLR